MLVYDQVPVSNRSEIEVTTTELSYGAFDKQTGRVSWKLTIPARSQTSKDMRYEVKYPKRETLTLE